MQGERRKEEKAVNGRVTGTEGKKKLLGKGKKKKGKTS